MHRGSAAFLLVAGFLVLGVTVGMLPGASLTQAAIAIAVIAMIIIFLAT